MNCSNNTWSAKVKRTYTAVLPISENRRGTCVGCGKCCKLPTKCVFLKKESNGKFCCSIYPIRSMNCRKYPRSETEWITKEECGYKFG